MEARVFHHQSPARWQRRSKAEEEERRKKRLEVQIISAQKLAKVHMLKKTRAYAVAWMDMHQDAKLSTEADRRGGRNPTWNKVLSFSAAEAEQLVETLGTNAALNVEIYSKSWLRDKLVGTVRVLLVDLLQGIPEKGKCFTFMVVRPSGRRKGLLNVGVRPEKAFYDDELVQRGAAAAASAPPDAVAVAASAPPDAAASAPPDAAAAPVAADTAAAVQQVAADTHRIAARLQQLHVEMDLSPTNASRLAPDFIASRDCAPSAGAVQWVAAESHRIPARLQHTNASLPALASRDHAPPAGAVQGVAADSHRIAARLQHRNASRHADSHRIAARLQQLHVEMDLSRTARTKASRSDSTRREYAPSAPPFHGSY